MRLPVFFSVSRHEQHDFDAMSTYGRLKMQIETTVFFIIFFYENHSTQALNE